MRLTIQQIAEACGGRLHRVDGDAVVSRVVIDSRRAHAGDLFVALRGENADGHGFAEDALARGAVAALVTEPIDGSSIVCGDALDALRDIAAACRARLRATVIAITGSSGKTGTKDLIAAACGRSKRTVASEASFNNEIGVPLTILAADGDTEVLVVEVGARGAGHIASLMPAVRPDIAVVVNVGAAHVGMFGGVEATARAKGELVEALGVDGTAVLNADDARVRDMATRTRASVMLAGSAPDASVRATDVTLDGHARATFRVSDGDGVADVTMRIPGEHAVANATLAIAAARAAGIGLADAAAGVAACEPGAWRMQTIETRRGVRILNDAYNANPDSMSAALKTLVAMARGRPTWAVLGYMAELGDHELEAHDRVGRLVVRLNVGHLVTVGRQARAIHEAARLEGMFGGEAIFASSVDEAVEVLREHVEDDAIVLVKGSRSAGLERVAEALQEALA